MAGGTVRQPYAEVTSSPSQGSVTGRYSITVTSSLIKIFIDQLGNWVRSLEEALLRPPPAPLSTAVLYIFKDDVHGFSSSDICFNGNASVQLSYASPRLSYAQWLRLTLNKFTLYRTQGHKRPEHEFVSSPGIDSWAP
jgi:hypothetical protein